MIKNNMERKFNKIKKILGEDSTYVVITDKAATINGDAFEVMCAITQVLHSIIDEGFPKELAQELINPVFMDEEELIKHLDKKAKEINKKLKKIEKEDKE